MKTRTLASTAAAVLVTAALAAGCSSAPDLTYAPAAYGVPGHCYYVDSAAEAVALQDAGLCPRSWAPTLMPVTWEETYYSYYSSPAYYAVYVPARGRTVYVQRETTFGRTHHTAITTRSKTATYRTSTGKTVKGTQVTSKTRFGSGKSFSVQKNGGGSLRSGSSSGSKPGSSSGSVRSGSSSGSGSRSGSLRSGSYSGSRSSSRSH